MLSAKINPKVDYRVKYKTFRKNMENLQDPRLGKEF
jgi:hypothetical protein